MVGEQEAFDLITEFTMSYLGVGVLIGFIVGLIIGLLIYVVLHKSEERRFRTFMRDKKPKMFDNYVELNQDYEEIRNFWR